MTLIIKTIWTFLFISPFISFSQGPITDSLKTHLKETKSDTTRCRILNALIECAESEAIWPEYNAELMRFTENKLKTCAPSMRSFYSKYYALSLNNIGYLKMIEGNKEEAIEYYSRALKIQNNIGYKSGAAASLLNLGFLFRQQGNTAKALENYHSALKLQLEENDKVGMATSYNNIAYVFDSQNEYKKALEYYEFSLKISTELNDKDGIGLCYNNMAYIYKQFGDPKCTLSKDDCLREGNKIAVRYLKKAIPLLKETNNKPSLANTYNLLGGIYDQFGNPECFNSDCKKESEKQAFEYYTTALQLRIESKNVYDIALSYNTLAVFMQRTNNTKQALEYANKALAIGKELSAPELIMDAAGVLTKIFSQLDKPKDALKMYELYVHMKDTISNEETKKLAVKKTFQIEYERKAAADSVLVAEEKKVAAAQLEEEKTKKTALIGGLLLVALFGIFMFNRFKVTQKQNILIQQQKAELQEQKELVEEAQKETLDSIHYAKRIQTALIANTSFINEHIPNNFIYFNPKDIVSGDFYWASLHNNKFYLAVCDSTGHGVPGAFMSLLNIGFLSEAIKEKNIEKPNEIFNYVRERLINTISNEGQKDGMDGILICIDKTNNTIEYCAANNEPILIQNKNIVELPKDKMPVGKGEKTNSFTLHSVELKPNDTLYLYTDGFADQFGGPKGKKFKYKQLNELLLSLCDTSLKEQKNTLENTFKDWKGALEQVDDVCIIGIRL